MDKTVIGYVINKEHEKVILKRYPHREDRIKYLGIGNEVGYKQEPRNALINAFHDETGYFEEHWLEFAITGNDHFREHFFFVDVSLEYLARLETSPFVSFNIRNLPIEAGFTTKWLLLTLLDPSISRRCPIYVPTIDWRQS